MEVLQEVNSGKSSGATLCQRSSFQFVLTQFDTENDYIRSHRQDEPATLAMTIRFDRWHS